MSVQNLCVSPLSKPTPPMLLVVTAPFVLEGNSRSCGCSCFLKLRTIPPRPPWDYPSVFDTATDLSCSHCPQLLFLLRTVFGLHPRKRRNLSLLTPPPFVPSLQTTPRTCFPHRNKIAVSPCIALGHWSSPTPCLVSSQAPVLQWTVFLRPPVMLPGFVNRPPTATSGLGPFPMCPSEGTPPKNSPSPSLPQFTPWSSSIFFYAVHIPPPSTTTR